MSNPLQKFYVDANGNYLGSRVGYYDRKTKEPVHGAVPEGWVEVPTAPLHRLQKWVAGAWDNAPEPPKPKTVEEEITELKACIEALKKRDPQGRP